MIGHSFLAGGVAPIPGEVKAAASRHRAKRGFGLDFPRNRGKMNGGKWRNCGSANPGEFHLQRRRTKFLFIKASMVNWK
jgi:hypothetical protein